MPRRSSSHTTIQDPSTWHSCARHPRCTALHHSQSAWCEVREGGRRGGGGGGGGGQEEQCQLGCIMKPVRPCLGCLFPRPAPHQAAVSKPEPASVRSLIQSCCPGRTPEASDNPDCPCGMLQPELMIKREKINGPAGICQTCTAHVRLLPDPSPLRATHACIGKYSQLQLRLCHESKTL